MDELDANIARMKAAFDRKLARKNKPLIGKPQPLSPTLLPETAWTDDNGLLMQPDNQPERVEPNTGGFWSNLKRRLVWLEDR